MQRTVIRVIMRDRHSCTVRIAENRSGYALSLSWAARGGSTVLSCPLPFFPRTYVQERKYFCTTYYDTVRVYGSSQGTVPGTYSSKPWGSSHETIHAYSR